MDLDILRKAQSPARHHLSQITPLRQACIDWALSVNPTHLLTFNFHETYSPLSAEKALNKSYCLALSRVYRTRCEHLSASQMIPMVGFPEFTKAQEIHYHVLASIPASDPDAFLKHLGRRFKKEVPSSTFDVRELDENVARVAHYITKEQHHHVWAPDVLKPWLE